MAGDVAQFLRNKFLASLSETESELSDVVLISDLGAIKDIVIAIDTRRLTGDYYCRFISVLLDLTDALTKCRVFSHKWKKHSHHKTHLVVFNHLGLRKICFVLKMKKRLAAIKRIFEAEFRESSSRPDPEENLKSKLPVLEAEVMGFDEQLRKIRDFLLKSSRSSGAGFSAVGIVGMAGAGKTTLVSEVLSSWMVLGKFSPIIWLCLSNIIKENKQVEEEIVKCMLSNLDHDAVADGDGIIQEEEKTISSKLERLNQHLSGKRYLIVLDDVCHMNDFYSDLGQQIQVQEGDKKVGYRLSHGLPKGSGGAIIVTSRISEVVEAMVVPAEGSDQHYNSLIIPLETLNRETCWDIFKHTVFGYIPDFEYQQHLEKFESEIKDLCYGLPSAARTLAEIMSQNPQNLRRTSPSYLKYEHLPDSFHIKKSPVLVFIDTYYRKRGEELIEKFCDLLTTKQVFGKEAYAYNPEPVLKDVYGTLEKLKQSNCGFASEIQKKMRIIVVGGNDVVNRILGVICDLKLPESPSIAPVPLSYVNEFAASFGWEDISNISPLQSLLVDVARAKSLRTDSWHWLIRMKPGSSLTNRLPRCLHEVGTADNPTFSGRFWYEFSLDVLSAYLTSVAIVKVLNHLGQWEMLHIPGSLNSICCLNLPVFGGKRGHLCVTKNMMEDGKTSFIDDGRLEVIGDERWSSDWALLDQVRGIRFEFIEGAKWPLDIRIDGAFLPTNDLVEIEISYHGQVNILALPDCAAKSIHLSSQSSASQAKAKD
ncbi:uncharacterized protein Pyn_05416 [Prunus yedoensis var. nudiflora]|uniref:NB-ARC domain-containing protein n=1 Tax=Prunus yedoensis var. nudiflora TaxID=2094558 RepID=A0A314ZSS0_PRUYE|nr:uncharacterized protein Pyn_05416 [Prunus yedoensis var. nudiflora]